MTTQVNEGLWLRFRRVILSWIVLLLFVAAFTSILIADPAWPSRSRMFPIAFTSVAIVLAAIEILTPYIGFLRRWLLPGKALDLALDEELTEDRVVGEEMVAFVWWLMLAGSVVVFGFHLTVPIFMVIYLRTKAKASVLMAASLTIVFWLILFVGLQSVLNTPWPEPLIDIAGWIMPQS